MSKIERQDDSIAWHHVMNRGLAHRTVIENSTDARFFLALLARIVRRGLLEVHAFSLMSNHFHLLVRCQEGRLSESMRLLQSTYVRWFNRARNRDGPLFRGRYFSRRIQSEAHWVNVLRYIDANAKEARIADESAEYPYCSRAYYSRGSGPRWLDRGEVEREVREREGSASYSPVLYDHAFAKDVWEAEVVERRLALPRYRSSGFRDLVAGAPPAVQSWMNEQAQLADGTLPGSPIASGERVMTSIDVLERGEPNWRMRSDARMRRAWPILRAGLLRTAAGLRQREIAGMLHCSANTAGRMLALHRGWVERDASYRARVVGAMAEVKARGERSVCRG